MQSFRFIHASDFHLETPPHGLAEAPDTLREILLEAPYRAANNVFDAALRHEVDFAILSGDLVSPTSAGPRALVFLREQFARLDQQRIQVYWAGGEADQIATWPPALNWPANVHFFPEQHVRRFEHRRHDLAVCELVGQSRPALGTLCFEHFIASDPNRFSIAVAHGDTTGTNIAASGIRYWALGGEHEPTLPVETTPLVHSPGTPQGRSPQEQGPHSCTLVDVGVDGDIRTSPVVTDVLRFSREIIQPPPHATINEIENAIRERLEALAASAEHITWLVSIGIECEDVTCRQRDLRAWATTTLATLRGEFGYRSPPIWATDLAVPPPEVPRSWRDQENLLGDYLRTVERAHAPDAPPFNLNRFLPAGDASADLLRLLHGDEPGRRRALDEAAQLGATLLSPQEAFA